jgi:protease-4
LERNRIDQKQNQLSFLWVTTASGGYYIACNANTILPKATQLQDQLSFGILPNFTPLATKIGINTEQVETHQNAANYSPFVSIDENFKAVTLEGVEHIYKTFVTHS